MQLYRNRALKSKMRKLTRKSSDTGMPKQVGQDVWDASAHIKRTSGSLLIEPANSSTHTPSTDPKSTVLETLGEIACLIASGIVGLLAWVVL